jgi:hypothetical protein
MIDVRHLDLLAVIEAVQRAAQGRSAKVWVLGNVDDPENLDLERISGGSKDTDMLRSGPTRRPQIRPVGPGILRLDQRGVRLLEYPIT